MAVIYKGYLKGYVLHDDGVIEKIKKEAVNLTVKCPVCGGAATKIANNRYKYDYCQSVFGLSLKNVVPCKNTNNLRLFSRKVKR